MTIREKKSHAWKSLSFCMAEDDEGGREGGGGGTLVGLIVPLLVLLVLLFLQPRWHARDFVMLIKKAVPAKRKYCDVLCQYVLFYILEVHCLWSNWISCRLLFCVYTQSSNE